MVDGLKKIIDADLRWFSQIRKDNINKPPRKIMKNNLLKISELILIPFF